MFFTSNRHSVISFLKTKLAGWFRDAAAASGRFHRQTFQERAKVQTLRVTFKGDIPSGAGSHHHQDMLKYALPRPDCERVPDVIYTPSGMAWSEGRLIERFSIKTPSLRDLLYAPRMSECILVEQGTLVEDETPYTYGDWVGGFLGTLLASKSFLEPLLLPDWLARKSYVQRDLHKIGVSSIVVDRPALIKEAVVLRKRVPSYYWGQEQVKAYRDRFGVQLSVPAPGSIVYLSREHVVSEVLHREYPSRAVSRIVNEFGGTVVDTSKVAASFEDALPSQAETVIADQGSAIFALLHWQTTNVIEIVRDRWWHNSSLCLAHATGVQNYAIIVCDNLGDVELKARITSHLQDFGALPPNVILPRIPAGKYG